MQIWYLPRSIFSFDQKFLSIFELLSHPHLIHLFYHLQHEARSNWSTTETRRGNKTASGHSSLANSICQGFKKMLKRVFNPFVDASLMDCFQGLSKNWTDAVILAKFSFRCESKIGVSGKWKSSRREMEYVLRILGDFVVAVFILLVFIYFTLLLCLCDRVVYCFHSPEKCCVIHDKKHPNRVKKSWL